VPAGELVRLMMAEAEQAIARAASC